MELKWAARFDQSQASGTIAIRAARSRAGGCVVGVVFAPPSDAARDEGRIVGLGPTEARMEVDATSTQAGARTNTRSHVVEAVIRGRRRRIWSDGQKRLIVLETMQR